MEYVVFISHSGEDTWIAKKMAADCESVQASPFLDAARIAVGSKFEEDILQALRVAHELIVLITPWAMDRPYVWLEIGAAWLRGIPIVVVLLGLTVAQFQEKANVPVALKERNIISLNEFERYVSELRERVSHHDRSE
jgi:TIR domain